MKKNTAGQSIGAQIVTAANNTAFTGSVTVYVTGDSGAQAIGSVGSGACAHEGNGYHSYRPSQAETNYAHAAFTFVGSGAKPETVQVWPSEIVVDADGFVECNVHRMTDENDTSNIFSAPESQVIGKYGAFDKLYVQLAQSQVFVQPATAAALTTLSGQVLKKNVSYTHTNDSTSVAASVTITET